jgi:diguanylate cyclase (GGDEF)-like protein/PAS domain S-box-containing protein
MPKYKSSKLEQLELVINATKIAIWDWQIQSGELFFNDRWAEIIGYSVNDLQPIHFQTWVDSIHKDDLDRSQALLEQHWQGNIALYKAEFRMRHKQGHFVWVLATGKTIEWHDNGLPKRMIGTHLDITQRKLDEQTLLTTTQLLDDSQKIARVGGWQLDLLSGELFWTAETYRIHDTSPEEFNPTVDAGVGYFLPESRQRLSKALDAAINRAESYDLELETYTTKGRKIDVRTTGVAIKKDNKIIKLTGIFQDISEQKNVQRKLETSITDLARVNSQLKLSANYDALTGLPNRNLLADRMQQSIMRNERHKQSIAIAFLDLDGFKEINDLHGHSIGDDLLCHISKQLKESMRECDTLARFGGDEFVIILDELDSPNECIPVLSRMLKHASKPVLINGNNIQVSASIGVTIYPQDQSNSDQLIRHADQAMYIAKQSGKNCFHLFDVAKDTEKKNQHEEIENIRAGIKNHEFVLYYQPKININSNKVVGLEALIRWQHPREGLLPPSAFLHITEQDMLAIEVGEWVIKTALKQLSSWSKQTINLPISVNISPLQIQHVDFVQRLQVILQQFPDFEPGQLEFEILETSALSEIEQVSNVIHQCHELGIIFSIDDFGTGYSSLTYLKRLPTEYLKIDQSFIRDMLNDPDDRAIVLGIIQLAKAFERTIVAEGVETTAHGEQLLELGSYIAQGYGIAKPMPANAFIEWLAQWELNNEWEYLSNRS